MCQEHAAHPQSTTRSHGRPGTLRHGQTVLLIEDDAEMRRLLERTLVRDGYQVVAVDDGDQALDWLGLCLEGGSLEHVPALIVSDVRLPNFSGLELLEGLLCAVPEIPVILITGFPSEETYVEAFELGAARVLSKPFELDALRFAVSSVLEARSESTRERSGGWTKLSA